MVHPALAPGFDSRLAPSGVDSVEGTIPAKNDAYIHFDAVM